MSHQLNFDNCLSYLGWANSPFARVQTCRDDETVRNLNKLLSEQENIKFFYLSSKNEIFSSRNQEFEKLLNNINLSCDIIRREICSLGGIPVKENEVSHIYVSSLATVVGVTPHSLMRKKATLSLARALEKRMDHHLAKLFETSRIAVQTIKALRELLGFRVHILETF